MNTSMPAFSLTWRIEKPVYQLELNSSKLGESLHMPGWGKPYNDSWYKASCVFKSNLLFNDDIWDQIGNDTLRIKLEVDTREEEGWVESVRYWWLKQGLRFLINKDMEHDVVEVTGN